MAEVETAEGIDLMADGLAAQLSRQLGFGLKWDMGWMHDTLEYMRQDPVHRRYPSQQADLSHALRLSGKFRPAAFHDEVVYGKGLVLRRNPR